jgi:hypothetical protein
VYLGKKDPGTAWSLRSRALAEGLVLYEESVNEFGFPLREVNDPERDGWYEVDDSLVDYSQAAMEEYRKATKDQDPGVQLRVIDTWEGEEARPAAARHVVRPPRDEAGLDAVGPGLEGTQDLSG